MKGGLSKAPHRSLLKADGLTDEEISRPLIAVINSANEIIPGHLMLDKIAAAVKTGVLIGGGTPIEITTIGVCDGIAMNHVGMRYSLVSRETIADSVEIAVAAHAFDAVVLIPNCDKVIPGMLMAAARLDLPTVVISRRADARRSRAQGRGGRPRHRVHRRRQGHRGNDERGRPARARGPRLPHVRQLRRALHRQLDELPGRGHRHGAAGQRHDPRGLLGAHPARQARRHARHGAARGGRDRPPDHDARGDPQRDDARHGVRRQLQHGAAPHGDRARGGRRHHARRLGRGQRAHAQPGAHLARRATCTWRTSTRSAASRRSCASSTSAGSSRAMR